MKNSQTLRQLVANAQASPKVKGIFFTGSTAKTIGKHSDIDLVIILNRNSSHIRSLYTLVERHFADIFFFDLPFLQKLLPKKSFSGNALEGIFVTWLRQGKIMYDPTNILQHLQSRLEARKPLVVAEQEKWDVWVKVNYMRMENERYYRARNRTYTAALELQLLYSVTELITAFFTFRGIPWRGEKNALAYLTGRDPKTLAAFTSFVHSTSLSDKMSAYRKLFNRTHTKKFAPWGKQFTIPLTNENHYSRKLEPFWRTISRKS